VNGVRLRRQGGKLRRKEKGERLPRQKKKNGLNSKRTEPVEQGETVWERGEGVGWERRVFGAKKTIWHLEGTPPG